MRGPSVHDPSGRVSENRADSFDFSLARYLQFLYMVKLGEDGAISVLNSKRE